MAWKYPKRPIKGTYVTDIDAINENFLTVIEESTGYLNEHNFQGPGLGESGKVLSVSDPNQLIATRGEHETLAGKTNRLPEDAAYRLHYTRYSKNPDDLDATGWVRFRGSDFYQTKNINGFKLEKTFSGGLLWICCSVSLHNHTAPAIKNYKKFQLEAPFKKGFGFNLALQVDGAIIPESLLGTGDITQENFQDEEPNVLAGSAGSEGNPPSADRARVDKVYPAGGGGVNGARNALVLDAVVPITPGQHTIKLAILDIRGSNANQENNDVHVSSIELFALEILY